MNQQYTAASEVKRGEQQIERHAAGKLPYGEFLKNYVLQNRPVVVEDAVQRWPALRKWTPGFFKTSFGSKMISVTRKEAMPFSEFIDAVEASTETAPGPYMYRLFIGPHLPELLCDLTPHNEYSFPRRLASRLMLKPWRRPDGYLKLLIGGIGGKFPVMHFDGENMHAAITEIYGDKEFVLFKPEDGQFLYPDPSVPQHSLISDLEHPALDKYPLFRKATPYRTVLRPGEMIFIPSRWWHSARVVSTSISVCQNVLDSSNWNGYVDEVCYRGGGMQSIKRIVKIACLKNLGIALSMLESLSRSRVVGASIIGRRIARLVPTEASESLKPVEWPVGDWVVRS